MSAFGSANVHRLNSGGVIGDNGTGQGSESASSMNAFAQSASALSVGLQAFSTSALAMKEALNSFASNSMSLTDAINKMPRSITLNATHSMTVTFNGAEMLGRLMPELKAYALETVKEEISRTMKNSFPEATIRQD